MRRIDRVFAYVKEQTTGYSNTEAAEQVGVTTNEVATALKIQRSNSSKDLNQLVRAGYIKKTQTRPVKYYVAKKNEQPSVSKKIATEADFSTETLPPNDHVFSRLIGANGSMKNAIEQAKAAILYPPTGLNCLITGPTGSGKTHFAHAMFQFAKQQQVMEKSQDLVVFNCADYAHNPELLMSHLFGYVKGAFTGAETEKAGLIEQADGGMLFLDEIHRLPPEGQEMIFYFMDHGLYQRLGESNKQRQADVRIIAATTEEPTSALLETFIRRIPIHIQLPAFTKRPLTEQIELVKMLFAIEAARINRRFLLEEEVVKALLSSVTYGNIGQLKSNIQLVCARAFMNKMKQTEINITMDDLPDGLKEGLIHVTDRQFLREATAYLEPQILITPNESFVSFQRDAYELPYNLYDFIGKKAADLKEKGLDQEAIYDFISTDIQNHLRLFYKDHGFTFEAPNKLAELVDPAVLELTKKIYHKAKIALAYDFKQDFIYAFSLHISSFLKRAHLGEERAVNDHIRMMAIEFPQELAVAELIKEKIQQTFSVDVPEEELYYLTVLLVSLKNRQKTGYVNVVVIAHGNSTASSMVQVTKQLLHTDKLYAVDMPLDMSPQIAYEKVKQLVVETDEGKGTLLLVDMGSLTFFATDIAKETGITVKSLDMVTTPLVLEAARKATIVGIDVEDLYSTLKSFRGYGKGSPSTLMKASPVGNEKMKCILAICVSGKGTAQQMKRLLTNKLKENAISEVEVYPISLSDLQQELPNLQKKYHIIAATGIQDPQIQVPFLPLEQFIQIDLTDWLKKILLLDSLVLDVPQEELTESAAQALCLQMLKENFTFINVDKFFESFWSFATELFVHLAGKEKAYGMYINLINHLAGAIERALMQDELTISVEEQAEFRADPAYEQIHELVKRFTADIHLPLGEAEEYFIWQYLKQAQHIK